MKPLAVIRSIGELHEALRRRSDALGMSRNELDAIAKLPDNYAGKLFAPVPMKTIGKRTLCPIMGALHVELWLVARTDRAVEIARRIKSLENADATMPTRSKRRRANIFKGCAEWGQLMRARAVALASPRQRQESARRAALARWNGPRNVRAQG